MEFPRSRTSIFSSTFREDDQRVLDDYEDCADRSLLEIGTPLLDFDVKYFVDENGGDQETTAPWVPMEEEEEEVDRPWNDIEAFLMEDRITDLLLSGAEAVEAQDWALSSAITAKLNELLIDGKNGDDPFDRLAWFFTRALQNMTPPRAQNDCSLSLSRKTAHFPAFWMFQELSPYLKFAHLTANQAILEASRGEPEIHVVDFDIMEGIQWPPLMADLAAEERRSSLRITAIVGDLENIVFVEQTGTRLKQFADSIKFPFEFDQIVTRKEEDLTKIKMGYSSSLVVNCMIHQFHIPRRSNPPLELNSFLNGVAKLSPKLVVLGEEELFKLSKTPLSFVDFFFEAFHHYTALHESLSRSLSQGHRRKLRAIEEEFLGGVILGSFGRFPAEKKPRIFQEKGRDFPRKLKAAPLSNSNVSQANSLVSLFNGGFWVLSDSSRLGLCWESRTLLSVSVWVPIS